jgi:hypothetical protein
MGSEGGPWWNSVLVIGFSAFDAARTATTGQPGVRRSLAHSRSGWRSITPLWRGVRLGWSGAWAQLQPVINVPRRLRQATRIGARVNQVYYVAAFDIGYPYGGIRSSMPLHELTDDERRSHSRRAIEAMEVWLRRLVHETFSKAYGSHYLNAIGSDGNSIFNTQLKRKINGRLAQKTARCVDGTTLDELVGVVCKPETYNRHFKEHFMQPSHRDPVKRALSSIVLSK